MPGTTRQALPAGTVTFLFTDIEDSTRLVEQLGPAWAPVLEKHQSIIRRAVSEAGGTEVMTEGDSFFVVFGTAPGAVAAAVAAQRALAAEPWPDSAPIRVRMGVHTGEGMPGPDGDYIGLDVHRAARIAAAGHGGQVLLSEPTAALVRGALPPGVGLHDGREHRLKGLSRPERIFELSIDGLGERPRLRGPHNLPTQLTTFLGREREIGRIVDQLGKHRLVTLTGPGGTGKTRLGLEVAARSIERFPDGVFFVPLAALAEPELVPATIAQELGLPDRGGRAPLERLVDHLRDRRVLLVLDNFEQLVAAGSVVAHLLAGSGDLTILVTSRAALRVYGEREHPVPPLEVPDPRRLPELAELSQYEAVALFVDRATAVKPDFRLTNDNAAAVAEICYRLDGLPLAIELAAARTRLLTPHAMLARLQHRLDLLASGARDLPARQRTLRGAIAWSYELLEESDRELFRCLSVFVGGASLEAAESVCGQGQGGDVLYGLESLADKSLLRQETTPDDEPRFRMLETIREFALERLRESGQEEELRARHAQLFCSVADEASRHLLGSDKRRWLDRLEREHDNLRAAFGWAVEQQRADLALRLTQNLWRLWQMRGYLAEGYERALEALALPGAMGHPELYAAAIDAAGGLAYWHGDIEGARQHYEHALGLYRTLGDVRGEAEQLYNLSFTYTFDEAADAEGIERGIEVTRMALALYRQIDDRSGMAKALWGLSNVEYALGRTGQAREHGLEALHIVRALDDRFMVGWTLYTLALTDLVDRQLRDVRPRLVEALRLFRDADDVSGYVLVLDSLAFLAQLEGDLERAARLSGAVAHLEAMSGTGLNVQNRRLLGWDREPLRESPAWAEGERMSVEEAIAYALDDAASA